MTTLFVCNKGDETFSDSFNGQSYVFSKDKEVELPEIAAKHIFGYGDDNKEPYFVRLGWMKSLRDPAKSNEPPTVMETVIIGSVLLAALCLLAWFFTLAGSPITRGG